MAKAMTPRQLRTVDDLIGAGEWMFSQQEAQTLDAKSADAMNTTLKGQYKLVVEMPMQLLKLYVTSQIKKFEIPKHMLPSGMAIGRE